MSETKKGEKPGKAKINPWVEMVLLVAAAVGLTLGIQAFVVKPYKVPSASMYPTFNEAGSRILVNRLGTHFGWKPKVGQVLVFHPPRSADGEHSGFSGPYCGVNAGPSTGKPCPEGAGGTWKSTNYVKRLVAGPGDTISVKNYRVIRNGKPTDEPFINEECLQGQGGTDGNLPKTITIPEGYYFMMGDNRCRSNDSRFWGPVPRSAIVGPVFASYWPLNRIGGI